MFEPVSTTLGICWLGSAALNAYTRPGSAISAEAQMVSTAASAVVELAERSQALFDEKAAAISQLMALANDCAEQGWNGNAARALDAEALRNAMNFVRALPGNVPMPECAPEPDGSISLDWIQSRHRLFSLSVGGSNRLAFAWLDGADRGHGVARFDGLSVPLRVLAVIQSILDYGHASLRIT
jgi:hypothetical protein